MNFENPFSCDAIATKRLCDSRRRKQYFHLKAIEDTLRELLRPSYSINRVSPDLADALAAPEAAADAGADEKGFTPFPLLLLLIGGLGGLLLFLLLCSSSRRDIRARSTMARWLFSDSCRSRHMFTIGKESSRALESSAICIFTESTPSFIGHAMSSTTVNLPGGEIILGTIIAMRRKKQMIVLHATPNLFCR